MSPERIDTSKLSDSNQSKPSYPYQRQYLHWVSCSAGSKRPPSVCKLYSEYWIECVGSSPEVLLPPAVAEAARETGAVPLMMA